MKDEESKPKPLATISQILPDTTEALLAFYKDSRRDKTLRLKALKKLLALDPSLAKQLGGDIVSMTEKATIAGLIGDDNEAMAEIWHASMRDEKAKLLGNDRDPVLMMLADRVVTCWLRMQGAEWQAAQNRGERTIRHAEFLEREVGRMQQNYMLAMGYFSRYRMDRDRLRSMLPQPKAIEGKTFQD